MNADHTAVWSSLCALAATICGVLAVRAIFGRSPAGRVDLLASLAGLLALIGVYVHWPAAAQTVQRSALYLALCYSFWFWPDWARHMLDPHTRRLGHGARFRLSLALFAYSGLITLLTLSLLTSLLIWPGAIVGGLVGGLVGFLLASVGSMGLFYLWLRALLLLDTDAPPHERTEERHWFWKALLARAGALIAYVTAASVLWSVSDASGWNKSVVAGGGFALALAAFMFVAWVDSNNDVERERSETLAALSGQAIPGGIPLGGSAPSPTPVDTSG
jgi:hypothetical protein